MIWYNQRVQESSADVAAIQDTKELDEIAAKVRRQQSMVYARKQRHEGIFYVFLSFVLLLFSSLLSLRP